MTSTTAAATRRASDGSGAQPSRPGRYQPHMNVFGGEDRFWLGPEGGQYALYFKPGDPFDLDHWQTPERVRLGRMGHRRASRRHQSRFRKRMTLVNYSGTPFDIDVDRTVRLLSAAEAGSSLGEPARATASRLVAFESSNTVTNAGAAAPGRRSPGWCRSGFSGSSLPSPGDDDRDPVHAGTGVGARARSSTMPTSARCPPIG